MEKAAAQRADGQKARAERVGGAGRVWPGDVLASRSMALLWLDVRGGRERSQRLVEGAQCSGCATSEAEMISQHNFELLARACGSGTTGQRAIVTLAQRDPN